MNKKKTTKNKPFAVSITTIVFVFFFVFSIGTVLGLTLYTKNTQKDNSTKKQVTNKNFFIKQQEKEENNNNKEEEQEEILFYITPNEEKCISYHDIIRNYNKNIELEYETTETSIYIKNSQGTFYTVSSDKNRLTSEDVNNEIDDIVYYISFFLRDEGWQISRDSWSKSGPSRTEFGNVYIKNNDYLILYLAYNRNEEDVDKCPDYECISNLEQTKFFSIMVGNSENVPSDRKMISITDKDSYDERKLPQRIIEYNEYLFKQSNKNDCIKLENGNTGGGDLLSTLIVDYDAREKMNLQTYTTEYVTKLDNSITDVMKNEYNSYFYSFSVCHLDDNLDVVAGNIWPIEWPITLSEKGWTAAPGFLGSFGDRRAVIVLKDFNPIVYENIQTLDKSATGAEVMPCSESLSEENNQNVLWTCFEGLAVSEEEGVIGSYISEWTLSTTNKRLEKKDYTVYN